ncbi:hypothetical protein J6P11_05130 [bacterium]|nr:hypothetical protein [bacterium]
MSKMHSINSKDKMPIKNICLKYFFGSNQLLLPAIHKKLEFQNEIKKLNFRKLIL